MPHYPTHVRTHVRTHLYAHSCQHVFRIPHVYTQIYTAVRSWLPPGTPLLLVGASSGGAPAISALGIWDRRRADALAADDVETAQAVPQFTAAVVVGIAYDTSRCLRRFPEPYQSILLHGVKSHFVRQNESVLRPADPAAYNACLAAKDLQDFLNAAVPFAGFPSTAAYYDACNPVKFCPDITTPTLIVSAADDPCAVFENIDEPSPLFGGERHSQLTRATPLGVLAVTATGSHCPFLDGRICPFRRDAVNGTIMLDSWSDRATTEWLQAWL